MHRRHRLFGFALPSIVVIMAALVGAMAFVCATRPSPRRKVDSQPSVATHAIARTVVFARKHPLCLHVHRRHSGRHWRGINVDSHQLVGDGTDAHALPWTLVKPFSDPAGLWYAGIDPPAL